MSQPNTSGKVIKAAMIQPHMIKVVPAVPLATRFGLSGTV